MILTFIVKKWLDQEESDMYHSVIVKADGIQINYVGETYGDYDQYITTAIISLEEKGKFSELGLPNVGYDNNYMMNSFDLWAKKNDIDIEVSEEFVESKDKL